MGITIGPSDRQKGIVFLDRSKSSSAATHVMIVGVGRFQSPHVGSVTSPPISALAVADWFLARGPTSGFKNPQQPLASLAMTISAEDDDALTFYAGAPVPRAKFARVKTAVSAWVDRLNSNKDNLAILYVCSHGESLGSRTGFLLEEYGTDDKDRTAGLSEIEQFARALKNAAPIRQLLIFDCCRKKSSLDLPLDEQFGTKLISLSKPIDDHGAPRQQWIFAATALDEDSVGRKNMTTVFADSLLRSLQGAAADPSGGDWRITPADLVRTVPRFLTLHRREHETMQTPSGHFTNPFPICFCDEPRTVQTYVALKDDTRWAGCRLIVTGDKVIEFRGEDPPGPERFKVAEVEELRPLTVTAVDKNGVKIGQAVRRPRAPAEYVIIGAGEPASITSSPQEGTLAFEGHAPTVKIGPFNALITFDPGGPIWLRSAGVLKLTRIDAENENNRLRVIDDIEKACLNVFEMRGGELLDFHRAIEDMRIAGSKVTKMQWATMVDRIAEELRGRGYNRVRVPKRTSSKLFHHALSDFVTYLADEIPNDYTALTPTPVNIDSHQVRPFSVRPGTYRVTFDAPDGRNYTTTVEAKPNNITKISLEAIRPQRSWMRGALASGLIRLRENDDVAGHEVRHLEITARSVAWFQKKIGWKKKRTESSRSQRSRNNLFQVIPEPHQHNRFRGFRVECQWHSDPELGWVEIIQDSIHELCAVPVIEPELVVIVVDQFPAPNSAATSVVVDSARWTPLFGFLAMRNFAGGEVAFSALDVREAVRTKMADPFAATAGALIAVGSGRFDHFDIDEQWLRNLAERFPNIPDGPIILARRLAERAQSREQRAEVRKLLLEGYERGIPAFSLSLEWLESSLLEFADTELGDKDVLNAARSVRRVTVRIDPSKPLTTIRLRPQASNL